MSATLEVAVLALVYLLRLKHSCWKHSIQPPQVLLRICLTAGSSVSWCWQLLLRAVSQRQLLQMPLVLLT